MTDIGSIIKEIRTSKGFSQEELANASLLNLRTIQRIEKNSTKPYPKTLSLISEALDVNLEEIIGKESQENRNYLSFLHLSSLALFVMPLGNIILPFILWFLKKESIVGLRKAGANLLNFQITWTLISYIIIYYVFFGGNSGDPYSIFLLILSYLLFCLLNVIISVVYSVRSHKGYQQLKYPTLINFIK